MKSGKIYFVEPNRIHPELLDSRTCQILASADVVLHDAASPAGILALTRPSARHHNLGDAGSASAMTPEEIRARLVTYATQGFTVVRLTASGDSGAASTKGESDVLLECGIEFEILSGDVADRAGNEALTASA
jgi:siroheme synthase